MSIVSSGTSAETEISSRIKEILIALEFKVEDGSEIDPNNWTENPIAQLLIEGEEFDDVTGERKNTAALDYIIKYEFARNIPDEIRELQYFWAHELRDNINTTNINNPNYLVRSVLHTGWSVESYDGTITIVNYRITVKYENGTTC
jgi:hypothetical protein